MGRMTFVTSAALTGPCLANCLCPRVYTAGRSPGALTGSDSGAVLARAVAPLLYV
jgi:hypothetical protein